MMTNKDEETSPTEPPQTNFHHVSLSVEQVTEMELVRGSNNITAVVSVKMNLENADKLIQLLNDQIKVHKAGFITFTLEGRFT